MPIQGQDESKRALCSQFDSDLPAYLEGETRPGVLTHAAECAYCNAILRDLEEIRQSAKNVPLDEPPASVWANIRATLDAEGILRQQPSGLPAWLTAPGFLRFAGPAVAMAGLLALAITLLTPRYRVGENPATAKNNSPAASTMLQEAAVFPQAGELEQTVNELESTYKARERFLDPTLKAGYQKGLASLDDSIRECRDSVRQEPTNDLAQRYLITAYEQKAAVLQTALEYEGQ